MIKFAVYSDNEWVYPDSELTAQNVAEVYAARNGDVCFQLLTDYELESGEKIEFEYSAKGITADVMQMLPILVTKNSAPDYSVTDDYELVKDFVTRKAPFYAYDITKPLDDGETKAGRAAFFVRLNVAAYTPVGVQDTVLKLTLGDKTVEIPVNIKVYSVVVPDLYDASYHMTNWIHFDDGVKKISLSNLYKKEEFSEEYYEILENTMLNLVDMRNDTLMIPFGKPIRDKDGKVVDFDFTQVERVGNMALACGFKYIMGGFIVLWKDWKDEEMYLQWDNDVRCTSMEGFRQLKIYFAGVKKLIEDNGWEDCYWQCLVDEPQDANAMEYRALSAICRKCLPGIIINDPIESDKIQGAIDKWVVKQDVFDKRIDRYRELQAMGEEMWIYTCGFPSGKVMNRVIDLPLTASRLLMWMCYGYDAPGFLHFGYFLHNEDPFADANYHASRGRIFPAGNAHIVYPGSKGPWYSVRGHAQRTGAQDFELLNILGNRGEKEKAKAKELVNKLCRNFSDYETEASVFEAVRKELLEELG